MLVTPSPMYHFFHKYNIWEVHLPRPAKLIESQLIPDPTVDTFGAYVPSDLPKTGYRYFTQAVGSSSEEQDPRKSCITALRTLSRIITRQTDNERHTSTGDKHSKFLDVSRLYIMVIYLLSFTLQSTLHTEIWSLSLCNNPEQPCL